MAPNDSRGPRKATRYAVPIAVAGVAAATIGLVPALAASGEPDLPRLTAQQLVEKIAAADTDTLSGTVKVSTDLGLPSLDGLGDLGAAVGGPQDRAAGVSASEQIMKLASGTHTLRVAADGPDRQKLTFSDGTDYSLIHNGSDTWAYDGSTKEALHSTEPAGERDSRPGAAPEATPQELAEQALKAVDGTTKVSVDGTARIAGRDAYQLVVQPKQSGSTIGSVRIAVDAETGVPLKFTLSAKEGGKPVVDAGFTKVSFDRPAASEFALPKGAKVTEAPTDAPGEAKQGPGELPGLEGLFGGAAGEDGGVDVIGEGWTAIAELSGGPGAAELPKGAAKGEDDGARGDVPAAAGQFLDSLGDKVTGKFGSGTVFETRLVNALMTDDGTVYVGAVTKDALVAAADGRE
ncbi:sigma-E factor regulatory protein RseB domain-containing protein [Streptomyces sp. ODS05-4]|uniref:LolA family protein n=1 Tax=Streptomyces sp. ODS05-4 TaxID=2944939 RepID=UPI00210CF391|nr:sigma-E factor regulatory protein RseB domain-containing protein [Streptomyces sp. ODS05-4]